MVLGSVGAWSTEPGWAQHGPRLAGCTEHGFRVGTARSEPHLLSSAEARHPAGWALHCSRGEGTEEKGFVERALAGAGASEPGDLGLSCSSASSRCPPVTLGAV